MPEQNDHADVTVVIPAYRAALTIGRALESIRRQTLRPRAVVVVDDGSPDDTSAVVESYLDRMAGIELKLIRQTNAGPGAARNRALAHAETRYVAFLDSDDEWLPDKLAYSMDKLAGGNHLLVAHDSLEVEGNEERRLECARRFRDSRVHPYVGLYRRGYIDTTTVVTETEAVRAVGGFDETLQNAQDFDLWLKVLAQPDSSFLVFDDVLSRYHRTPGSVMTYIERRRRCCMAIARRHAPTLRRYPGLPWASFAFRTLAVHREAMQAHWRAHHWLDAILTPLLLVPSFLMIAPPFDNDETSRVARSSSPWVERFGWLWIAIATGLWVIQFGDIIPRLIHQLGLSPLLGTVL